MPGAAAQAAQDEDQRPEQEPARDHHASALTQFEMRQAHRH